MTHSARPTGRRIVPSLVAVLAVVFLALPTAVAGGGSDGTDTDATGDPPTDTAAPDGEEPPPDGTPAEPPPAPAPAPAEKPAPEAKKPAPKAEAVELRPPPRMKDWIGLGYDGSLGGLQALSFKYWASRVGFQVLFGMRFEAFRESSSADNDRAGFGFGVTGRFNLKLLQGDLVQLNLVAGAGLVMFRRPSSSSGTSTSFDFVAEVGIQPEVFITRTFTFHGLIGFGILMPGSDSPSGEDSFVLNLGTTSSSLFGVLAGLGFTFYLVPKAK